MDQLVKRIIFLIENLSISKSEFSARTDISLPIISHISSGRNKPSIEIIQKIMKAYPEINPDWLITGNGNWKILKKNDNKISVIKTQLELLELRLSNTKIELEQTAQLLNNLIKEVKKEENNT